MTPLHFLPSFKGDLEEIWLYVAKDSVAAADRLIDQICVRCQLLCEHPQAGLLRPDIAPDCRQFLVEGYVILYRIRDEHIDLVRALHGRRRQTSALIMPDP